MGRLWRRLPVVRLGCLGVVVVLVILAVVSVLGGGATRTVRGSARYVASLSAPHIGTASWTRPAAPAGDSPESTWGEDGWSNTGPVGVLDQSHLVVYVTVRNAGHVAGAPLCQIKATSPPGIENGHTVQGTAVLRGPTVQPGHSFWHRVLVFIPYGIPTYVNRISVACS